MRTVATSIGLIALVALPVFGSACLVEGEPANPPLLRVTSPQRSLIQGQTGSLVVTGTVAPNPLGAAVDRVVVNGTRATINGDGTFTATIDVPAGATLIHTVATDTAGGVATDTRSVLAGERRAPGANLQNAIAASISAPAFTQIGNAAGKLLKAADLKALIAPMNPVVRAGDEAGPDCLYGQAFVDNVTIADARISLAPTTGGLQFSATLDRPEINGHARYAVSCVNGQSNFRITATSVSVSGVLAVSVNGASGLSTEVLSPSVQLPGLEISASGIPGAISNLIPLEKVIQFVAPTAVRLFVTPLLNRAVGTLTGPQRLPVLGQTLNLQVTPSAIAFDPTGGDVMVGMRLLLDGAESSGGFLFTPNGAPALDPGAGVALGIADDLVNDVLAQVAAKGLLNLQLPGMSARVMLTSPPMVSADTTDGKLQLVLPDMMVMLGEQGRVAVNAKIAIAVRSAEGGASIAIDLGTPAIAIDSMEATGAMGGAGMAGAAGAAGAAGVADDAAAASVIDSGLVSAIQAATNDQRGSIADLLKNIPLPKVGGLTLTETSVAGSRGYVIVKTKLK